MDAAAVKMSSSSSVVGPAEDVVQALMEYLVDPMLPLKASTREAPSLYQQQLVAKQVFISFTCLEF
ncbi:unnamed protein product [Ilex paraguariensis]|uniref:DUF7913 domain-containing protein n=1 Tax=Ilex paraguariensis TaxID=185542 RepID=A0ABC8T207_9AQUA